MKKLQEELNLKLKQIKKVLSTETIVNIQPTITSIANYYKVNKLTYSLFAHKDFTHMGISRDGKYSSEDLLEQAKFVDKYIVYLKTKKVLELATGRGATCAYLAKKHPNITFEAIDLPNGQLDYAINKAKKTKKLSPKRRRLSQFIQLPKKFF